MKLDYGNTVEISKNAPHKYYPGEQGELCGVRCVETEEHAKASDVRIGTVMWIVEFLDGSSCEIPEEYLSLKG